MRRGNSESGSIPPSTPIFAIVFVSPLGVSPRLLVTVEPLLHGIAINPNCCN